MTEEEAQAAVDKMMAQYTTPPKAKAAPENDTGFLNSILGIGKSAVQGAAGAVRSAVGPMPTGEDISPLFRGDSNIPFTDIPLPGPGDLLMGTLDTLTNTAQRTGETSPILSALSGVMDVGSLGTLDKSMATTRATQALNAGDITADGYDEAIAEFNDEQQLEQEAIRAANPVAGFSGSLLGGVATGGGIAKLGLSAGTKLAPGLLSAASRTWYGKAALGGGLAAVEGGAYRMNKGGDLEAVAKDAGLSFLGGAAITSMLTGAGALIRRVKGAKLVDDIEEGVGAEMLRYINLENKGQGLPDLTPVQVQQRIEAMGPDATLLDAFPSLDLMAKEVIKADKGAAGFADKLHALVALRSDFMERFLPADGGTSGILSDTLNMAGVRSPKQFDFDIASRFERLRPRYTNVFTNNSSVSYGIKNIKTDLNKMFGDKSRWTTAQLEIIEGVESNIDYFIKKTATRAPAGMQRTRVLTLEQLTDLKNQVATMASSKKLRISGTDRVLPMENKDFYNVSKVASYLTEKLNVTVPDMIPLNKVYGNLARVKGAYEAGQEIMAEVGVDKKAFDLFLAAGAPRSAAEMRGFIEGAKQKIFLDIVQRAKSANSMKQVSEYVSSNLQIRKLKALVGDAEVDEMIKSIMPHVRKTLVADDLRKATLAPKRNIPQQPSNIINEVIDLLIAGGGPTGMTSKAGAGGALRRLVSNSPAANELAGQQQMFGNLLPLNAADAGNAVGGLQQLMSRVMRPSDAALITKGAAGGAALTPTSGQQ